MFSIHGSPVKVLLDVGSSDHKGSDKGQFAGLLSIQILLSTEDLLEIFGQGNSY